MGGWMAADERYSWSVTSRLSIDRRRVVTLSPQRRSAQA